MTDILKPFVAWDGEGCKGDDNYHPYSLFGSSHGWRVKYYDLTTDDCLNLMIETERAIPDAIHVGYSFGYDVNMILRQLPYPSLMMLKETTRTRYHGFDIQYIPRKWFRVSYGKSKRGRASMQIFDVFSFFNTRFDKALRKYDIGTEDQLQRIEAGKEERPLFDFQSISTDIEPYWESELELMVQLMDRLRTIVYGAGVKINSWHGPGALASWALGQNQVRLHMDKGLSEEVIEASRYAYFGGRFQGFLAGYHDGPVYSADINSAYGYSLSRLPSLQGGKWLHTDVPDRHSTDNQRMGIYRIRFAGDFSSSPMPLPHRSSSGSISFPSATEGWYHAPEAYLVRNDPRAEFLESYIFEDDGSYPFDWVRGQFEKRLELQEAGDPTEKTYKWMIASYYGQLAQRAGWEKHNGPPRWHQLEFAGAITAECRSLIYSAARACGDGLISIDTDGILSLVPITHIPGGSGDQLGQWKLEEYTGIFYLQNGIYWLRDANGDWLPPKSRGIPRKKLAFADIYPLVASGKPITIPQHMFIGYGLAARGRWDQWRKWIDVPRTITFGGNGKSIHSPALCGACGRGLGPADAMHRLVSVPPKSLYSSPHKLPWLDAMVPQPEVKDIKLYAEFDD
jgi:hypothetical protein